MALLDLQHMEAERGGHGGDGGHGGGSDVSLLLCDSAISWTLCV